MNLLSDGWRLSGVQCGECNDQNRIVELHRKDLPRVEEHTECPYCECHFEYNFEYRCPVNKEHSMVFYPSISKRLKTYESVHGTVTILEDYGLLDYDPSLSSISLLTKKLGNDPDLENYEWLTERMREGCRAPEWAKEAGGGCLDVKRKSPGPFEAGYCGWCC